MSELTPDYLNSILRYEASTGHLYWRERVDVPGFWNARYAGKRAGGVNGDGYVVVRIHNINYQTHRIIWAMENNGDAPEFLDHINGHRADNRIVNLRPATKAENSRNAKIRSDNSTGKKGVSWSVKDKKWKARIRINGKQKTLGYFSSLEEASAEYQRAAALAHKEFARSA
jgi:hypothetical protein